MFELLHNMHFMRPWWALLLLPIAVLWLYSYRHQHKRNKAIPTIAPHLLAALTVSASSVRRYLPAVLLATAVAVSLLILMGPSWQRQASPFEEDKAALYIALDVSDSMNSRDIQPSRLRRAKQKIRDLLAARAGGQTALIVYAGSAHTVLPLTDDANILDTYLAGISSQVMPKQGKFPELILPLLGKHYGLPVSVLLISDGISSHSRTAFQQYFEQSPYQLMVLGMGLDAAALTSKQLQSAPQDSAGLQALAKAAGGQYINATITDADVQTINQELKRFMQASADYQAPWHDASYPLVWLLLLLVLVLSWFNNGWVRSSVLCLCCLGSLGAPPVYAGGFADLWLSPDQQGRRHFERGEYSQAAASFEQLEWKATAYYVAEEFDLAAEYFSRINTTKAQFARANALAHAGRYLKALAIYRQLLAQTPDWPAVQSNQKIVQTIIDDINRLSASQQDKPNESFRVDELSTASDKANGAERTVLAQAERQSYNAEQLLNDPALNEQWLRSVQAKPERFLSAKFYLQLQQQTPSGAATP